MSSDPRMEPAAEIAMDWEQSFEQAVGPGVAATAAAGNSTSESAPAGLGWGFWLSVAWLVLVMFGAVFANLLPIQNPNYQDFGNVNAGPGIHHLLGTDFNGRDVFSRLIYGSRVSLVVGVGGMAIGMVLGGGLGLIAGYYGKTVDFVSSAGALVLLAFPQFVLLLAVVSFMGHKLWVITVTLGVLSSPLIFRLVRTSTQTFAQREFVHAAKALGARTSRIILREVLPNVAMTTLAFVFVGVGLLIMAEAGLAFVGLSVPLPTATWGSMINDGTSNLSRNGILWLWPSLAILFTILALNVAGEKIRNMLGVRQSFL